MSRQRIYWGIFAVALGVYFTMVLWTLPGISLSAGGLQPFDLRPMGYGTDEARDFLAALGPKGLALYTGPQRLLDMAYPALMACVLIGALQYAYDKGWLLTLLTFAVLVAMGSDYLENMRVSLMLAGDTSEQVISAASRATVMKSVLTLVAFVALLIGLARKGWQKWKTQ